MDKTEFIKKYGVANPKYESDLDTLIASEISKAGRKEAFTPPFKIRIGAHSDWIADANDKAVTACGKNTTEEMEYLVARLNRE